MPEEETKHFHCRKLNKRNFCPTSVWEDDDNLLGLGYHIFQTNPCSVFNQYFYFSGFNADIMEISKFN